MAEAKVQVRIKPLHGIGGVGEAGDVVMMAREEAEMYFLTGFVEYVEEAAPVEEASSEVKEEEHHVIMKPQNKRKK